MSDQTYSIGKLSATITTLASHRGRIKERLKASMLSFHAFNPQPFSEHVEEEFEQIDSVLRTISAEEAGDDGVFWASIDRLTEEDAEHLANDLLSLYFRVEREFFNVD